MGGLIINQYFTLGQKLWPLKQIGKLCENQWKVANYKSIKINYCPSSCVFFTLFEGPSKKTDATFSNQF